MKNLFDFFYHTKAERRACVLLVFLCIGTFIIPEYLDFAPHYDLTMLADAPKPIQVKRAWPESSKKRPTRQSYQTSFQGRNFKTTVLAPFDPNTVSIDALQEMGLPQSCARIWIKYRSKGGRFKQSEDILKVYGIPKGWYEKAKAYIQIQQVSDSPWSYEKTANTTFQHKQTYPKSEKSCSPIDINTADTSSWQSLRGIGKVLANRIVKFREKLGGFYTLEQVGETYGLADSVYQKILPCLQLNPTELKPLMINQVNFNTLASHPYLGFKAAKTIMNWKDQHGDFTKMEELEAIPGLDQTKLNHLRPYVQF